MTRYFTKPPVASFYVEDDHELPEPDPLASLMCPNMWRPIQVCWT